MNLQDIQKYGKGNIDRNLVKDFYAEIIHICNEAKSVMPNNPLAEIQSITFYINHIELRKNEFEFDLEGEKYEPDKTKIKYSKHTIDILQNAITWLTKHLKDLKTDYMRNSVISKTFPNGKEDLFRKILEHCNLLRTTEEYWGKLKSESTSEFCDIFWEACKGGLTDQDYFKTMKKTDLYGKIAELYEYYSPHRITPDAIRKALKKPNPIIRELAKKKISELLPLKNTLE